MRIIQAVEFGIKIFEKNVEQWTYFLVQSIYTSTKTTKIKKMINGVRYMTYKNIGQFLFSEVKGLSISTSFLTCGRIQLFDLFGISFDQKIIQIHIGIWFVLVPPKKLMFSFNFLWFCRIPQHQYKIIGLSPLWKSSNTAEVLV